MSAVEEFDLEEARSDGGTPPARSARRGRAQPWAWMLAAAALVGLGAANATPLPIALGLGGGADLRLLDVDMREEPTTVWTAELTFAEVMLTEHDRAVVATDDTGTGRSVLGIDLATGDEVWRYQDEAYTCMWGTSVGCVENPGTPEATLVTIQTSDGARHTWPHPNAVAVIGVGADRIVVESTDTFQEMVVLIDSDGAERWRVDADAVDSESSPSSWRQLEVVDDRLALHMSAVSIELATGAVSPFTRWPVSADVSVEVDDEAGTYTLHTPAESITLDFEETLIPFDDDVGGPVVLVQDEMGGLTASWRDGGIELWHHPATQASCQPLARLRGVIVVQCWTSAHNQLVALSPLTGEEMWSRAELSYPVAASSTSMLLVDYQDGGLLAVDVLSGTSHWSMPLAVSDLSGITELSNGLLLTTGHSITRLLWD